MYNSASAGGVYGAAVVEAIKATGAIVRLEPGDFQKILAKMDAPLVVFANVRGLFGGSHTQYLTSYKGLIFFSRSKEPLHFSGGVELVKAKKIWVPELF